MAQEGGSLVGQFVRNILIIVVVILIACALVWWVADWSSLYQYGTALIIAGILTVVIGLMGISGGIQSTRSFNYQQAESAGLETGAERAEDARRNFAEVYDFLIVMGSAGAISIVIGLIVRLVA